VADTIDWPPPPRPQRRGGLFLLALAAVLLLAGGTTLSYYVEALWYDSLGVADVFWKTLNLRAASLCRLRRRHVSHPLRIVSRAEAGAPRRSRRPADPDQRQPIRLPVEPVIKGVALGASLLVAVLTGAGMTAQWTTLALYWHAVGRRPRRRGAAVDPIFGRPLPFYLFTLPAWQLVSGWLMTLAVLRRRDRAVLRRHHRRHADARRARATGAPAWRGCRSRSPSCC
jgi:uncharacterized membrane protein (UPF0182 family)